jgi:hypothetical protein
MGEGVIDELRSQLERHDEWPTRQTSALVVDAARRLIQAIDMRAAMIEQMRRDVSPSAQAIGELLGRH